MLFALQGPCCGAFFDPPPTSQSGSDFPSHVVYLFHGINQSVHYLPIGLNTNKHKALFHQPLKLNLFFKNSKGH